MYNTFGDFFKVTTFGESHGDSIGCVIDGCPSGIKFDKGFIQYNLNLRRPGRNKYVTKRKEKDKLEVLSGVYKKRTTGAPICIIVKNINKISKDYEDIKDVFRPGHADITYYFKYGTRDHRGGGRSSARTTISLVIAGSIAKKILIDFFNIKVFSYLNSISDKKINFINKNFINSSFFFSPEGNEKKVIKKIKSVVEDCDSIGASIKTIISGLFPGIGDPCFKKLDMELSKIVLGLNAVKAISFGKGFSTIKKRGSENNDEINKFGFESNNSGGILGGISTGQDIVFDTFIKPTPSIFKKQRTIEKNFKEELDLNVKGRHDPCVAIRAPIIIDSIVSIIILNSIIIQKTNMFF
ncbi:Chorismate synthase [Candidatus Vidania fulgoroideae]|nr:Chorismate synthase [Candidatus Vidania fulgoroideae]